MGALKSQTKRLSFACGQTVALSECFKGDYGLQNGRQARGMMGGRRLVKRLLYLSIDLVIQDVEHMLPHHAGQTTDPGLGRCT